MSFDYTSKDIKASHCKKNVSNRHIIWETLKLNRQEEIYNESAASAVFKIYK